MTIPELIAKYTAMLEDADEHFEYAVEYGVDRQMDYHEGRGDVLRAVVSDLQTLLSEEKGDHR